MIEIALCDDNAEDIALIESYARSFAAEHSEFSLRLKTFSSPDELLLHINGGGFDLYILDVIMPEMSGIRLAEAIRSRGCRGEILFLTVSPEYALDAFSVHAGGYLLKPVRREDFDNELLRALQRLAPSEKGYALTVKTRDGIRRVPLDKLVMIESFNHMRTLTLSDDSVLETSSTLSELFDRLCEYENFHMPHRAYIVNLDYSMGIKRYGLLMPGNRWIPIPRRLYSSVREVFSNYFFK